MAISMLRSSTAVSVTYTAVTPQAATVRAPSKMRSSVVWKSTPPSSPAQPAIEDCGASSTVQLAAKATSKKSSSTRK
eukprot:scaffold100203_cov58-Phaeocystis_antarctica.AAC.5